MVIEVSTVAVFEATLLGVGTVLGKFQISSSKVGAGV